jgi:DtxR family Mn-dependent transcriptional regulator
VPDSPGGPLSDLETGVRARITRITDKNPAVLAYLAEHGLMPGATLRVLERAPFDGPVTVAVEAASAAPAPSPLALAYRMAAAIRAEALASFDGPL